jgi:hypothetical protein
LTFSAILFCFLSFLTLYNINSNNNATPTNTTVKVRALHTDLVDHLEGSLLALAEGDDGRGGGSIKAFGRDREAGLYHQISIHGDEEEEAGEEGDGGDGGSEDINIMGGNLQAVVEADARQETDTPGTNTARQEEERAGGGLA